jgi:hypothetical protein
MEQREGIGYVLLIAGIALILYSFYTGIGLYNSFQSSFAAAQSIQQSQYQSQSQSSNGSINSAIGALSGLGGIGSSLETLTSSGLYMYGMVILLFLFATIGFKISLLGINVMKTEQKPLQKPPQQPQKA